MRLQTSEPVSNLFFDINEGCVPMIFMKKHFPLKTFRRCVSVLALTTLLPALGLAATAPEIGRAHV